MKRSPFTYAEEADPFADLIRELPEFVPGDLTGDMPVLVITAAPDLPARLYGGNAQTVEISGLDYTLHLDLSKLPAGVAPAGAWTVAWDEANNIYTRVPAVGGSGGGGIDEAPNDGQTYGRQSSGWDALGSAAQVNYTISTAAPTDPEGTDGDVWYQVI